MSKVAVVTGASSGLGEEFCKQLADAGYKVGMIARRKDPMKKLQEELSSQKKEIRVYSCDVLDFSELQGAMDYFEKELGEIELLIANAGVAQVMPLHRFDPKLGKTMIDVNITGVMNSIAAVMPKFMEREKGHVVAISSLASFLTPPKSYIYSASKAAINTYIKGLWMEAIDYNVDVTAVYVGYVKTPMTAGNKFSMPFIMDVDEAVHAILKGVHKKKREIYLPKKLYYVTRTMSALPLAVQKLLYGKSRKSTKKG